MIVVLIVEECSSKAIVVTVRYYSDHIFALPLIVIQHFVFVIVVATSDIIL